MPPPAIRLKSLEEVTQKVYVFFHLCPLNDWRRIASEQLEAVISSGLYDYAEKIYICISSNENNVDKQPLVEDFLQDFEDRDKIEILLSVNSVQYENSTIDAMIDKAVETKDALFFYCHAKGSFHPSPLQEKWRKAMNYYLIEKWRHITVILNVYKTAGVFMKKLINYDLQPKMIYSGNFWWAQSNYLASRTKIGQHKIRGRAEDFILEIFNLKDHANVASVGLLNTYINNYFFNQEE